MERVRRAEEEKKQRDERRQAARERRRAAKAEAERKRMANLIQCSGKMVLCSKLLPMLMKDGHRVLIFSQFKMVLDLLEEYLEFAMMRWVRGSDGG